MTHLRIFISSPGDVGREREIADRVLTRLQAEFHGRAQLEPYFWEYEPMLAVKDYQANIPSTAEFDIVICILWSRLGSRLHSSYRKPDGGVYESGTEYELDTARAAHDRTGVPDLIVYHNKNIPVLPFEPEEVFEERQAQYKKLKAFMDRWFRDRTEDVWRAASNSYSNLAEFEEKFEDHMRKLIQLRLPENERVTGTAIEPIWKEGSPFRGLQIFDFAHAPVFFGRTRAIDDVLTALRKQWVNHNSAFVLVLGASGSGKSSLIRAGVLPLLIKPGAMEGVALWRWAVLRPGDAGGDLFASLASALVQKTALPELLSSGRTEAQLAAQLRDNPDAVEVRVDENLNHAADLHRMEDYHYLISQAEKLEKEGRTVDAQQARQNAATLQAPATRLVLVVDQMEELFTLGISDEQRDSFVHALDLLVRGGHVAVLATLRNDFYAQYQKVPALVALAQGDGKYDLAKPSPAELGQMIRLPALAAGLRFGEDAQTHQGLDEVLRDVTVEDTSVLPLLEFALDQLYERRDGPILTHDAYIRLGGVEGALARRAEEEFLKLNPEAQAAFDRVMPGVIKIGVGEQETPTRHWAEMKDLTASPGAKGLVDAFVAARLFQTDKNKADQAIVSVCHEALLVHWPRLANWLKENREFLRVRARLEAAASDWEEHGRHVDYLVTGRRLAEAEDLFAKRRGDLTAREAAYIGASSHAAKLAAQQKIRFWQIIAGIAAAVLVLVGILAFFAVAEKNTAVAARAMAQQTLAQSDSARGIELIRQGKDAEALAYLARAVRTDPGNRATVAQLYTLLVSQHSWLLPTQAAAMKHDGSITTIGYSTNGSEIVTTSWDQTARLWNAETGQPIGEQMHHTDLVTSAHFNHDGTRVVTSSDDKTAQVWDAQTGEPAGPPLRHPQFVNFADFSPDGKRVVTICGDQMTRIWDVATGQIIGQPMPHPSSVRCACFNPDGSRLLTVSQDRAYLWDAPSGQLLAQQSLNGELIPLACFSPDGTRIGVAAGQDVQFYDPQLDKVTGRGIHQAGVVYNFSFSPDSSQIVTGSDDKTAQLWNVSTGKPVGDAMVHEKWVASAHFSADGSRILSVSADNVAHLWDATNGHALSEPLPNVFQAAISPDGMRVAATGTDNAARIWNAAPGEATPLTLYHPDMVRWVNVSPDGTRVVTAGGDNIARLWNISDAQPIGQPMQHDAPVNTACFSPDGFEIVTSTGGLSISGTNITSPDSAMARLWDGHTGATIGQPMLHHGIVNSAFFSSDAARILTASDDHTAQLWDAHTGQPVGSPMQHQDIVLAARFNSDGTRVVTASRDKTARLWNGQTGAAIGHPFQLDDLVRDADIRSDGKEIATACGNDVRLWDADSGLAIGDPARATNSINSVRFSPDGTRLVFTSDDTTARLLDTRFAQPIGQPMSHPDKVDSAEFSPDGDELVTVTTNLLLGGFGLNGTTDHGSAQLWDGHTAQPIGRPLTHPGGGIECVAFSPDGSRLVTGSEDHTARIWDILPPKDAPVPPWLPDMAEAVGGLALSDSGSLDTVQPDKLNALRRQLATASGDDFWSKAGRWFFADRTTRTISPQSPLTIADNRVRDAAAAPKKSPIFDLFNSK